MRFKHLGLAMMAAFCATPALAATTLDQVRAHGALRCGVVATPEDWNKTDLHGPLAPLSLEICKAVAVATLGTQAKVQAKTYASENEAEDGVSKHEVDLSVGVTPDATSEWHSHISFSPAIFYDSLRILVRHDYPANSIADLAGRNVCVVEGTDNEKILHAQTVARGIAINSMEFQEEGEMDDAVAVRHCDALSAYTSRLALVKSEYPKQLSDDKMLPESLALAPVAVAYRDDDKQWSRIVNWTIYTLIQAEASGVTQANVQAQRHSEDPIVQRLLGVDWATSRALGLQARDWGAQVISVVGNYGEIYERTVGMKSSLKLPRGLNALWLNGGLMAPLPVQ